jgi:hypothetical protein
MGIAEGDAPLKRRLRLELAAKEAPETLAVEVRKRLTEIARALLRGRKLRTLAADLEAQRHASSIRSRRLTLPKPRLSWRVPRSRLACGGPSRHDRLHARQGPVEPLPTCRTAFSGVLKPRVIRR